MIASSIAASGLSASLTRFSASAAKVASAGSSNGSVDLADEAIEQMAAKRDAEANIAVLQTTYDMQRSTFQLFA